MKVQEYAALDAVALASLVRAGDLSPLEITEAAIAAIEALNPALNALVLKDFERARAQARSVRVDLPLSGVPFLIKDIGVFVEGWPTTMSSRFQVGAAPRPDSEIVARWRAAGSVFLGKTNTPEYADDFVTEPALHGVTRNPWNLGLTVGGSSGGAAAAVASGMVPVASGSDVGGSIRVPSACCGLFGLKPSRGLNPVGPYYAEGGAGLNCEHVLSRTVRDCAAFLDVTAGPEPGAPYRVTRPVPSYLQALKGPLHRLRIAQITESIGGAPVDPEILGRVDAARALLEDLGHEVVTARFPDDVQAAAAGEGWAVLWLADCAMAVRDRALELGRGPHADEIEQLSHYIVERIDRLSALDYLQVRRLAHRINLSMAHAFREFDLVMTPSTATLPPPVGSIRSNEPGFTYERWCAVSYAFAPFSELFNVTGQPAASLPLFESAGGMPIGIQLVGRQDQDHVVLRLAADLEAATGWTSRHPPLHWAGRLP
jgi:amidase